MRRERSQQFEKRFKIRFDGAILLHRPQTDHERTHRGVVMQRLDVLPDFLDCFVKHDMFRTALFFQFSLGEFPNTLQKSRDTQNRLIAKIAAILEWSHKYKIGT